MEHRTRVVAAASGVVGLFLAVQLGALALVDPYVASGGAPVDDPGDPRNVLLFFAVILVATAAMLAAIRYDLDSVIRGFVVFACGWITWLVASTVLAPLASGTVGSGSVGSALQLLGVVGPFLAALALVAALLVHPEWYVIDAAGVLLGAGAAGLFGISFEPQVAILFLVVLAVYDAVSVYGTEHMLALAEGVSDLNLPVLFVVPTVAGYSLLADDGPATLEGDGDGDEPPVSGDGSGARAGGAGDDAAESRPDEVADSDASANLAGDSTDTNDDADDLPRRDALYVGLGDAVMPSILVASAARFVEEAPAFDVPLLALNAPALGALVGTLAGLVVLLWLVLRGRAHAGLPLLNGGAILGYFLGALASGVALADAVWV